MIFVLRLIIFSFLIFFGFHLLLRSKNLRAVVSVVYGCVLVRYTFLCRVHLYVNVSAADYGHTTVTLSTGEKILQLLKSIFGMQANGNLAGNYAQAFMLSILLMILFGYLVLLWMIDGGRGSSTVSNPVKDVATTGEQRRYVITRQNPGKKSVEALLICIVTSITIELLQGLTHLGTTDLLDILANTIGGGVGIFITLVWVKKQNCVGE